jgi:aminoglycoside phosphotransferase (APT) family kinase protein
VHLRVFAKGVASARTELAAAERAGEYVPVPELLHFGEQSAWTGPYALLEWIEGSMLDTALAQDASTAEAFGRSCGATLARLRNVSFDASGMFDETLSITHAFDARRAGFVHFVEQCLQGRARERLGERLADELWDFCQKKSVVLDVLDAHATLVHGDFGGSNLVVQSSSTGASIAAVIDWEYAYSGHGIADVGHILRAPLGQLPGFEAGLVAGFQDEGMPLPPGWKRQAVLSDLLAWVEFANRDSPGPNVVAASIREITATMRRWRDL